MTVAAVGVGQDHPTARNSSGQRQYRPALHHQPSHASAASTGNCLEEAGASTSPDLGAANRPIQGWAWGERRCRAAQRCPRPVDQATNRSAGEAESNRDLLMACAIQRRADKYLPLESGKRGHSGQRRARLQPLLDELVDFLPAGRLRDLVRYGDHDAQIVEGDVVRDAVEPWPDVPHLRAGRERSPCLQERLLEGVLSASRARLEASAVGEQLLSISPDESLERRLVSLTRQGKQTAVGLRLKELE